MSEDSIKDARRALIKTRRNEQRELEFLLTYVFGPARIALVPDALLPASASLGAAVDAALTLPLEEAAFAIVGDINNEIVPRWVQVRLEGEGQTLIIEDQQPDWRGSEKFRDLARP